MGLMSSSTFSRSESFPRLKPKSSGVAADKVREEMQGKFKSLQVIYIFAFIWSCA